jgi:hypothetical protein
LPQSTYRRRSEMSTLKNVTNCQFLGESNNWPATQNGDIDW